MTAEDWTFGVFVGPLFIAGVWVMTLRVWRTGSDVGAAVSWFTGTGRGLRGYHAALGPGVTLLWAGAIATLVQEQMESSPDWLNWPIGICFGAGLVLMLLAFWMWAVQWPRFLIPPQFRERSAGGQHRKPFVSEYSLT